MAAFDPAEPDKPWLTPVERVCEGERIAGIGTLSQEPPTEGTFLIDLAARRWLRVLPTYFDRFEAVSPDGNTIVYHLADGLAAFDVDGSDLRQLGGKSAAFPPAAAFSPDGEVLAIWGMESPLTLTPWPDGEPVEVGIPGPVNSAAWSGTTLAASTAEGIYFIAADGTAIRATDQAAGGFAWARHQSLLAFWTSDDQDGSILSTVAPGEEPRVLARLPGERVRVHRASWSSDGSLLAVGFSHPAPRPADPGIDIRDFLHDIRVIDVATGHTRFTITGAGSRIEWSPVESLLLFDGNTCSEDWRLMLVDGDGRDLRPLSEDRNGWHLGLAWSPDGREVATGWVESNAVTTIDVHSRESRTIIRGPRHIRAVRWVSADRLLVTTSAGTGFCEGDTPQETTQVVFP